MRFALVVLMAGFALAQDVNVTKVVEVRYSDTSRLHTLLVPSKGITMRIDPAGKFIVFQGIQKEVEVLEEVLKKIDVPPINLEFTFELIAGSKTTGKSTDLPPALGGVAKEMKTLFGFQSVTLIDTMTIRIQEGKDSGANGALPSLMTADANPPKATYSINIKHAFANGTKGSRLVRLGDLRFNAKIPFTTTFAGNTQFQFSEMGIQTGLDVREGQRVVVGKVGMDSGSNPFFLVVSCKVVE